MVSPTYYIAETFESIQGEGNCAGAKSLFLRFQHCNLTCSWCDTKFTWHKNKTLEASTREQVLAIINKSASPNVIFTGGEPTLYPLDALVVEGKRFHVETNGTIIPTEPLNITLADGSRFQREAMNEAVIRQFNWVISPKMNNANQTLDEKVLHYWAEKDWCIFKFIIQNSNDLTEVDKLVNRFNLDKKRVYIGLEGCTLESQLKPDLVDELMERGYNYSPRLHVLLWGAKRKK
ncbi:MAG: 7-carboxy-7-deazaguanine synthase QueE [Paludibacteraceae bacterium]|nr:7-carboxy-7-deazaguanine synthase QueE [Paludibacteraceae bacterium]